MPEVEDMISFCASLVTVDEEINVIRLVHYTTQEYFERIRLSWIPCGQTEISICLTYLSFDSFSTKGYSFSYLLANYMFLNYAAQFWGKHAREALPGTVKDFLLRFLGLKSNLWCLSTTLSYWSTELPKRKAVSAVHLVADSELVELLPYVFQSGFPADSKDSSGRTPLSSAASKGHLAVVKLLLERNDVDVDSKDNCGCTALRYAAESGYETVVKLLLERDVDINCKDNRGRTALIYAALEGHETVVKLLSERDDVNMDSKDKNGWTALIYAVRWGHETMVKLLLEWDDIDVNCLDAEGLTPIDLAEP